MRFLGRIYGQGKTTVRWRLICRGASPPAIPWKKRVNFWRTPFACISK